LIAAASPPTPPRLAAKEHDGQLRLNQSNIIKTDLDASTGIFHVIDRVLIPEGLDVSGLTTACAPAIADISTVNTGTDPRSVLNLAIEHGVPELESVLAASRSERDPRAWTRRWAFMVCKRVWGRRDCLH